MAQIPSKLNNQLHRLTGFAMGAGFMYFFDPVSGRRRRSLIRDQLVHFNKTSAHWLRGKRKHAIGRTRGKIAEARRSLQTHTVEDFILEERVRARLGHIVPYTHFINLRSCDGHVLVAGRALKKDLSLILDTVKLTPGTHTVESRLILEDSQEEIYEKGPIKASELNPYQESPEAASA